jgi:alkaline phosphatase D
MKRLSPLLLLLVMLGTAAGCRRTSPGTPAAAPSSAEVLPAVTTIAFGSCSDQKRPQVLWDDLLADRPDLWIWLGDNVYGDTENMDTLRTKYDRQKAHPLYAQLRQSTRIVGVWDDHDYGVNDGGKEYPRRRESQQLMLDFLDVPANSPLRQREGAYSAHTFGPQGRRVKVILLDGRYFRDSLRKSGRDNVPNPDGDLLGAAQWRWLENELRTSDADVHLIGCGIQFLPEEHPFEKWANFPASRQRLLDLLGQTRPKGTILLSGDRHIAEFSRVTVPGLPYPLFDVTSSGLTHTWAAPRPEANRHRVGPLIVQLNYGLITIDWGARPLAATVQIRGDNGATHHQEVLRF